MLHPLAVYLFDHDPVKSCVMSSLFPKTPPAIWLRSLCRLSCGESLEKVFDGQLVYWNTQVFIQHNQLPSVESSRPLMWPRPAFIRLLLHTTYEDVMASSNGNSA